MTRLSCGKVILRFHDIRSRDISNILVLNVFIIVDNGFMLSLDELNSFYKNRNAMLKVKYHIRKMNKGWMSSYYRKAAQYALSLILLSAAFVKNDIRHVSKLK